MEERDVQIRGYRIRLPLDVFVVASANPEDYTNRGRIITPLKDRYGSQIRTHYPRTVEHEIDIMEQERSAVRGRGVSRSIVPEYMKEIVAEITPPRAAQPRHQPALRRLRPRLDRQLREPAGQRRQRRAIRVGESGRWCRASATCASVIPSTAGKVEFETVDDGKEEQILEKLIQGALIASSTATSASRTSTSWSRASRRASMLCRSADMRRPMQYVRAASRRVGGLKAAIQKLHGHGESGDASPRWSSSCSKACT